MTASPCARSSPWGRRWALPFARFFIDWGQPFQNPRPLPQGIAVNYNEALSKYPRG